MSEQRYASDRGSVEGGRRERSVVESSLVRSAEALSASIEAEAVTKHDPGYSLDPLGSGCAGFLASDLVAVGEMVEMLRRLMFPGFFEPMGGPGARSEQDIRPVLARVAATLRGEVASAMRYQPNNAERDDAGAGSGEGLGGGGGDAGVDSASHCERVVARFLERLPEVRRLLSLDVQASYDGDPAAEHTDECVWTYPGVDAIFAHRVAHELYKLDVPLLPRIIAEQAHSRTGIDINPGAQIGESFFIDHGSGVVIGETTIIGKHCKVYQGVTLGARSFPKDERGRVIRGIKRHPTLGDRVTVYAGAVILGGDTVIGDDSVIAGGVFITQSVPAGHIVQQPRAEPVHLPKKSKGMDAKPAETQPPTQGEQRDLDWLGDGAGI